MNDIDCDAAAEAASHEYQIDLLNEEVARLRAELDNAAAAAVANMSLACEKEREADALRVDAMRYRWLRDNEELNNGPHPVYFPDGFNEPTQNFIGGSRLDELVDAAMGADA